MNLFGGKDRKNKGPVSESLEQHMSVEGLNFVIAVFHSQIFVEATNIPRGEYTDYIKATKFEDRLKDKTKLGTFTRLASTIYAGLQPEATTVPNLPEPVLSMISTSPEIAREAADKAASIAKEFAAKEKTFISGEAKFSGAEAPSELDFNDKTAVVDRLRDIIFSNNPDDAARLIYDGLLKKHLEGRSETQIK